MARLPQPGSDEGTWGQILNDYLSAAHNTDGTLKDNVVTNASLAPNSIDATVIVDSSITEAKLDSTVQAKLNVGSGGTIADASPSVKGIVQLSGDLGGTAASPTVPGLAGKANTAHTHVVADTTGLQAALDAKQAAGSYATASHTHVASAVTDFTEATQDVIGSSLAAGTNVTLNYDDPSGITTISATPGAGVTDLSTTTNGTSVTVVSSTGNDAILPAATTTDAGVFVATDKTKLNGIATGATANSSDATLLDRANHTGTQTIATVTNLQTSLDGKAAAAHTHVVGDTTGLQIALDAKADQATTYTKSEVDTSLSGKASTSHTHNVSDINAGSFAISRFPIGVALDEYQASNGTWPSTSAEVTRRVNWISYPGNSTPPAATGRPAAVPGLDSYVLRTS